VSDPVERLPALIERLYEVVAEMEALFPGRRFTPDGHLVGSIGEALAAFMFDLTLVTPSTGGYDARTADGRAVEIKATQGDAVSLRGERATAELVVVLRIGKDGSGEVVYAGPAAPVWGAAGAVGSNGQRRIGLSTLGRLVGSRDLPVVRRLGD
jgi:hypothetical protein